MFVAQLTPSCLLNPDRVLQKDLLDEEKRKGIDYILGVAKGQNGAAQLCMVGVEGSAKDRPVLALFTAICSPASKPASIVPCATHTLHPEDCQKRVKKGLACVTSGD